MIRSARHHVGGGELLNDDKVVFMETGNRNIKYERWAVTGADNARGKTSLRYLQNAPMPLQGFA